MATRGTSSGIGAGRPITNVGVRESGIAAVGRVPWGTHFCQFYRSRDDLLETLVPYFEAGLRDHEACLWITAAPLEAEAAEAAMVDAVPALKRHLATGQITIRDPYDWYRPGDGFLADDVLKAWLEHVQRARRDGYAGLRLTGNTSWLGREGWDDFMAYETAVHRRAHRYDILGLCTYSLERCDADAVLDVLRNHEFALARCQGDWQVVESAALKVTHDEQAHDDEIPSRVMRRTRELEAALQARDDFLAMLGHELRNPLAAVRNVSELIRTVGGQPPVRRAGEVLERQVRHLCRLADDLLDVARLRRDSLTLHEEDVEFGAVLAAALEATRPQIEARQHTLTLTLPRGAIGLRADPVRLAQMFGNLLDNAAKYTPEGGRIWLASERDGEQVVVTVRDTGKGMAADVLPHVFEPFRQGARSHERHEGGLGLGLALVRRIAELHGGTVEARSDGVGHGSAFVVRLPIQRAAPAPAVAGGASVTEPAPRCRVLIVDDNRDATETLAMLVDLMGHEVRTAFDGESAVALARDFLPDVVLLDVGLPGIDGYEVARRLRRQSGREPAVLVALTGHGQPDDRRRALAAGFDRHELKPLAAATLEPLLAARSRSR